jgi:hypothetical protein
LARGGSLTVERQLAIYRLEAGRYGPPTVFELKGPTRITAVPGVTVDWDEVLAEVDELD